MPDSIREGYDTSVGSDDRSVVSVTKSWGIVLGLVLLIGVILIAVFLMSGGETSQGNYGAGNTATHPAGP